MPGNETEFQPSQPPDGAGSRSTLSFFLGLYLLYGMRTPWLTSSRPLDFVHPLSDRSASEAPHILHSDHLQRCATPDRRYEELARSEAGSTEKVSRAKAPLIGQQAFPIGLGGWIWWGDGRGPYWRALTLPKFRLLRRAVCVCSALVGLPFRRCGAHL